MVSAIRYLIYQIVSCYVAGEGVLPDVPPSSAWSRRRDRVRRTFPVSLVNGPHVPTSPAALLSPCESTAHEEHAAVRSAAVRPDPGRRLRAGIRCRHRAPVGGDRSDCRRPGGPVLREHAGRPREERPAAQAREPRVQRPHVGEYESGAAEGPAGGRAETRSPGGCDLPESGALQACRSHPRQAGRAAARRRVLAAGGVLLPALRAVGRPAVGCGQGQASRPERAGRLVECQVHQPVAGGREERRAGGGQRRRAGRPFERRTRGGGAGREVQGARRQVADSPW